jgi:hypothetical protein
MRNERAIVWAAGLLAGTLRLGVAHGDCTDQRTILPADRAAMGAVMTASLRALPPAPAGWVITHSDETPDPPKWVCAELVRRPWACSYTRHYSQTAKTSGPDAKVAQSYEALQKDAAAKQPKLDALMAKITKLNEQIVALVQKGDYAGMQPLSEQRDKLQAEYERIANASDATAGFEAAVAEQNQDSGFNITIDLNPDLEYEGEGATLLPTPSGAQTAFQYHYVAKEEDITIAVVLFGTWHKADATRWVIVAKPGVRLSAPHAIAVVIRAAHERVASVLAAIDYSALAAQLGK